MPKTNLKIASEEGQVSSNGHKHGSKKYDFVIYVYRRIRCISRMRYVAPQKRTAFGNKYWSMEVIG